MVHAHDILDAVRKALQSEARIGFPRHPIHIALSAGDLILEGEVSDIAAKKLALERAAAVAGPRALIDRLRVAPAEWMGDGAIRDHMRDALLGEPALANCSIRVLVKGQWESVRTSDWSTGTIDVRVDDGVVTLDGSVVGLGLKRLAGVLAWWVPGSRDVINGLAVTPPEDDSDAEISDAVRMALEKDPMVDPSQIRVTTHDAIVTLQGQVPTESERDVAEFDAWYVFGVDKVINHIRVRA